MPLAVLVACIVLSGCGGEDNIPLKKVDFVLDAPPKDYVEKRPGLGKAGASARMLETHPKSTNPYPNQ
jgi:hypothetical protein